MLQQPMKFSLNFLAAVVLSITLFNCKNANKEDFQPKQVYQSDALILTQITENSFVHTSYKQTNDFGNVPCNGLVVTDNNEAIIFDTPTDDQSAAELIQWVREKLQYKIVAIIPTHFHDDCLGGLKAFHDNGIPSYAYFKTIELAQENNFVVPQNSFSDSLMLSIGKSRIIAKHFGEGHTKDNVVGYFPSENLLFGGCLIKEVGASEGYTGDANVPAWSGTVENIKKGLPGVKLVVPGHGQYGDGELLNYTIQLFGNRE